MIDARDADAIAALDRTHETLREIRMDWPTQ